MSLKKEALQTGMKRFGSKICYRMSRHKRGSPKGKVPYILPVTCAPLKQASFPGLHLFWLVITQARFPELSTPRGSQAVVQRFTWQIIVSVASDPKTNKAY